MVNVAVFILSELLCFVVKNYKRFDKSAIIDIISKFYHDDELYAAKVELNKHFATVSESAEVPVILTRPFSSSPVMVAFVTVLRACDTGYW